MRSSLARSRSAFGALLAISLAAIGAGAGCSVDDKTQVTIALSSETQIPEELDSFGLRVISTRTGELRFSKDYFPTSGREFPTTLAVIPLDEDSLASPIRVEIEGRKGAAVFLRRQAVLSYAPGRNLLLSLPLRMACFQFHDCGPNSTCAGGQCVSDVVDIGRAVDFDPAIVFPTNPASCFDEERCLSDDMPVVVEQDCSFAIPDGASRALGVGNVSIRWAAARGRILALEEGDAIEGWTRLSDARGLLSRGVCDSHLRRTGLDGSPLVADFAETVYFSATCASKTWRIPFCISPVTDHSGIGAVRLPR